MLPFRVVRSRPYKLTLAHGHLRCVYGGVVCISIDNRTYIWYKRCEHAIYLASTAVFLRPERPITLQFYQAEVHDEKAQEYF